METETKSKLAVNKLAKWSSTLGTGLVKIKSISKVSMSVTVEIMEPIGAYGPGDTVVVDRPELTPINENETPNPSWNTWSLIQEARKQLASNKGNSTFISELFHWIVDRLEKFDISWAKHGPITFVITTDDGHWGQGDSIDYAAQAAYANGASKIARAMLTIVINDATPWVNDYGVVNSSSQSALKNIGIVGTVGSIINANKKK